MALMAVMVPTTTPVVTWVVPFPTLAALAELAIGVGLVAALAILTAAALAMLHRGTVEHPPAWLGFRAFQA